MNKLFALSRLGLPTGVAALLALTLAFAVPTGSAFAQKQGEAAASTEKEGATAKKKTRRNTAGQTAARERQKKCGAEWREAKEAGKTDGQTWPKFWSACNKRLKAKAG